MLERIYQAVWCQVFATSWTDADPRQPETRRITARQAADAAAGESVHIWDPSMQDAAIAAKTKADAARPLPTADDFTIDGEFVEFYADGEEAPCERFTLRIDEVDGDGYTCFSLYCDGTLHDGFTSLEEVARSFPKVAADLDGWKSDRLAPFAVVRAAAFDLAGIEDPGTPGEHDEGSEDEDEDEDEEG